MFPEELASFVLTGELRLRRPSRVWTVRSRLVPPNPLQSSLQTTRAKRPARHCCPSSISHPIEGTQDPSHSRHNASGKRGTQKNIILLVKLILLTLWGFWTLAFKLSHWQYCENILCRSSSVLCRIYHPHYYILDFAACCRGRPTTQSGLNRFLANVEMRWAMNEQIVQVNPKMC